PRSGRCAARSLYPSLGRCADPCAHGAPFGRGRHGGRRNLPRPLAGEGCARDVGSAWRPDTRHRRDGGAPRPEAAGGRCAKRSWRSHLARVCAARTALPACRARLALRIPTDPHAGSIAHEPASGADEVSPTTLIETTLRGKRALLLRDNCEHVVDEAAKAVQALLRALPHVHLLATSREALGVEGESVYRVPSLTMPPAEEIETAADVSASEAGALFVERARAVAPTFALTERNAAVGE